MQTIGLSFNSDFTAAEVIKETEKAVCVVPVCGKSRGRMFWLPKTQLLRTGVTHHPAGDCTQYVLKSWIAKKLQATFQNPFGYNDYTALFQQP